MMWTRRFPTPSEVRGHRLATALGAALAVLAVSSCLFDPRDAPPPCTLGTPGCSTPRPLNPPLTADIAFENIRLALLKNGTDGPNLVPNYDQSLSPNFLYVPDADASATAANRFCGAGVPFFADWGHARELRFMQEILESPTAPDSAALTYLSKTEADDIPDPDVTRYRVDYVLSLVHAATDTTARLAECYSGTALWDFSGVLRQEFLLVRWEDLNTLPGVACPGGQVPGTVGMLRATDGSCQE